MLGGRDTTDVVIPGPKTKDGTAGSGTRGGTSGTASTAEGVVAAAPAAPGGALGSFATGLLYRGLKLTASAIIVRCGLVVTLDE